MLIRLTSKSKNQLKMNNQLSVVSSQEKEFFSEWNVDVVQINRKKYFMITENRTLFTIIKHARNVNNTELFEEYFNEILQEVFNGLIDSSVPIALKQFDFTYSSTENNYVRRAQIDHLYHAKHLVDDGINSFQINRYPIKAIGFKFPLDYFIDEMGLILKEYNVYFDKDEDEINMGY